MHERSRTPKPPQQPGSFTPRRPVPASPAARADGTRLLAPPAAEDAVRSTGRPLDASTRGLMESRFGRDLGGVRVHTDATAAESARAVHALAYTVGQDVVFAAGKYAPDTVSGTSLLAHELTHTIQQSRATAGAPARSQTQFGEQEAERNSERVTAGSMLHVEGRVASGAMQKADDKKVDDTAKGIIAAGKDATKPIDQRAVDAVNSIVKSYYDPALVDKVVYDEKETGLRTTYTGKGKDIKGQVTVGKYFIENLEAQFARRVLQVGHEMQHVQQQRDGMGGADKTFEREFLAHSWEGTEPAKAGTGRMPHASRVAHIDEALRNYYCMPDADQKKYAEKKAEILKVRETEDKAGGNEHTEPPTGCTLKK